MEKDTSPAGYLYAISAAVFWGTSGVAAKYLFLHDVTPVQLTQLRMTIAAAVLFLGLFIGNRRLLRIDRRDVLYFAILGGGGMAATQFTYLYAISQIKTAAAILLQYLGPGLMALYMSLFVGERLSRTTVISIVGAFAGCYFAVGAYNMNLFYLNAAGILGGLGAAVAMAWYSIQAEYGMRRYEPLTVVFYAFFFGGLSIVFCFSPLSAFTRSYSGEAVFWFLYVGILGTAVPFTCYFLALNRIRATRAGTTATLEPITAGVVAFLILGERMEPLQIFGGVLVIGAVVLLQMKRELDQNAPSALRAHAEGRLSGEAAGR